MSLFYRAMLWLDIVVCLIVIRALHGKSATLDSVFDSMIADVTPPENSGMSPAISAPVFTIMYRDMITGDTIGEWLTYTDMTAAQDACAAFNTAYVHRCYAFWIRELDPN